LDVGPAVGPHHGPGVLWHQSRNKQKRLGLKTATQPENMNLEHVQSSSSYGAPVELRLLTWPGMAGCLVLVAYQRRWHRRRFPVLPRPCSLKCLFNLLTPLPTAHLALSVVGCYRPHVVPTQPVAARVLCRTEWTTDNGGPGGGTKSASYGDPWVTWGGVGRGGGETDTGASASVGSNAFRCCYKPGSWPGECSTVLFLCRPHTQRGTPPVGVPSGVAMAMGWGPVPDIR
jgi:hypothetical protein